MPCIKQWFTMAGKCFHESELLLIIHEKWCHFLRIGHQIEIPLRSEDLEDWKNCSACAFWDSVVHDASTRLEGLHFLPVVKIFQQLFCVAPRCIAWCPHSCVQQELKKAKEANNWPFSWSDMFLWENRKCIDWGASHPKDQSFVTNF